MKRVISIILTAILIITLIPISAIAADEFTAPEDFAFTIDEENNSVILGKYNGSSDSVLAVFQFVTDKENGETCWF